MKLNLFICLFLFSNLFFAQNFVATYNVKLDNDRDTPIIRKMKSVKLILNVNDNQSLFEVDKKLEIGDDFNYRLAVATAGGFIKHYINLKTKKKIVKEPYFSKDYLIETETKDLGWSITKDKRKIGKYTCYKATNSITVVVYRTQQEEQREVVAWFCPEISSSFGPIGYYGLPGLIIELKHDKTIYYLDTINFATKPVITIPTKGQKVTKEELDQIKKDSQPKK